MSSAIPRIKILSQNLQLVIYSLGDENFTVTFFGIVLAVKELSVIPYVVNIIVTDDPLSCLQKHSQSAATLPNDLQNFQKDEFISKLTIKEGRTGLGEKQSSEEVIQRSTFKHSARRIRVGS